MRCIYEVFCEWFVSRSVWSGGRVQMGRFIWIQQFYQTALWSCNLGLMTFRPPLRRSCWHTYRYRNISQKQRVQKQTTSSMSCCNLLSLMWSHGFIQWKFNLRLISRSGCNHPCFLTEPHFHLSVFVNWWSSGTKGKIPLIRLNWKICLLIIHPE